MISRFIGGILLIVGTSIGGGMLALPVANASLGFWQSSLFLLACWAIMTLGALFILEANLYLPRGKHIISMAQATLGWPGMLLAWLSYLFLLYTLLSAYISGGADVMQGLLGRLDLGLSDWQASLAFTLLFGLIVYGGIHSVDYANRVLMFGKLAVYVLLVLLIAPYLRVEQFSGGNWRSIQASLMILITSFGFAIIVPNLRDYFEDDIPRLRRVILWGSLIPLFCYLAWDAVIMGALPNRGVHSLESLMQDAHTTSSLAAMISETVNQSLISGLFNFFTSICMLTAFLGVSLCLFSFLADGLKLRQRGGHGLGLFLLTFLPPLLIVIYYPGAYLQALSYAGFFCVILLLLLPALMCQFGRQRFQGPYQVWGGSLITGLVIIVSIGLLGFEIFKIY